MLNTEAVYQDLGKKSAEARNQHDEARARFHANHFRLAKAMEKPEDRLVADRLYREAYEQHRAAVQAYSHACVI